MTDKTQEIAQILKHHRAKIDDLDDKIVALLCERLGVIRNVAVIKKRENIPAALQNRIDEVINRNAEKAGDLGGDSDFVRKLYTDIVSHAIATENAHLNQK